MNKKGKVGDIIKFINTCCEKGQGKEGKIVGLTENLGLPIILVPECTCTSSYSTFECPASVQCSWSCIEILSQKGQLTFDFYTVR